MSPTTRRPSEIEAPLSSQSTPLPYALFLLQALFALAASLFGNALADRLRVEPAMPYLWTFLILVVLVLVGLISQRMDEVSPRAGRRTAAPPARTGLRGLLDAALAGPLTAFPVALLVGTLVAALSVLAVPRGDIPIGALWGYELVAFLVTLALTYLAVAYTRDLMVLLGLWLGLALGMSNGLLLLRPLENGPLFTTVGWIVALCALGAIFRFWLFRGAGVARPAPVRDRSPRSR